LCHRAIAKEKLLKDRGGAGRKARLFPFCLQTASIPVFPFDFSQVKLDGLKPSSLGRLESATRLGPWASG
jgi:hypothetical protein